jgi:hypothetical protein
MSARIVCAFGSVLQSHSKPVRRGVNALHLGVLAFSNPGLLRCAGIAQNIADFIFHCPCAVSPGEILSRN